ncbi:MAG TPA: helix-hairpin-helix domain-containing protein [Longimicrobium sp.]|nr:helix-hairpin-helix domain-containing protein [Longimicrobium sp.]
MARPKNAGDGRAGKTDGKTAGDGLAKRGRTSAPADPPAVKEGSTSPRGRKAADGAVAKSGVAKPAKAPARRAPAPDGPDLAADLRAFAVARPEGWNHDDWLAFLAHLAGRGHDTSDADGIGLRLERERLGVMLEGVQGMGPRRVQTLVDRYDTLYSIRAAGVDELAALPGMNRPLAEKVRQSLA